MEAMRLLAGPLVGAAIGLSTNYIAIKMVFRPLEPRYLLGFRIPFTPGIVPRRKDALAGQLAQAVFAKFFNWDDLEAVFLSEAFVEAAVDRICMALRSDMSLSQIQEEIPEETALALEEALSDAIVRRMLDHKILDRALEKSCRELNGTRETPGKGALIGTILAEYHGPVVEMMEAYLREDGSGLIRSLLAEERQGTGSETIGSVTRALWGEDEELKVCLRLLYRDFMAKNVRPIVESIDIISQITEKVEKMSAAEIEDIVEDVISRELSLVVLFGGLLGMLIGVVNIFI